MGLRPIDALGWENRRAGALTCKLLIFCTRRRVIRSNLNGFTVLLLRGITVYTGISGPCRLSKFLLL